MTDNRVSWAVGIVIAVCICPHVKARVHVFQGEQSASIDLISLILRWAPVCSGIALKFPVIACVSEPIIAIARDFLTIREW